MAIPVWTAGQVLTASDVNTWFVPRFVYKTAATSRASTTSLTADPHLVLPADANAVYMLTGFLDYEADAAADLKFQITVPAGGALDYAWMGYTLTDLFSNNAGQTAASVSLIGGGGAGVARGVSIQGMLTTAGTAGNVTVLWAQNASSATATILHQYCFLQLDRVG